MFRLHFTAILFRFRCGLARYKLETNPWRFERNSENKIGYRGITYVRRSVGRLGITGIFVVSIFFGRTLQREGLVTTILGKLKLIFLCTLSRELKGVPNCVGCVPSWVSWFCNISTSVSSVRAFVVVVGQNYIYVGSN